ncbi:hypothetical protein [Hymenobacter negativus]|uniref:Copper chaperone n=1 Tax=Hymenobacter negativus TaxID=2795026 RepID=A0ABS3QKU3_9BACT|nr:hypothetical protein [Hymenobacter negativus]MBO2011852.1 hypothetical protein [Hymenobacter negativus]
MPEVEVFRTDVACPCIATSLLRCLRVRFPTWRITFDLDDCDRILRVASPAGPPDARAVAALLHAHGHACTPLPD